MLLMESRLSSVTTAYRGGGSCITLRVQPRALRGEVLRADQAWALRGRDCGGQVTGLRVGDRGPPEYSRPKKEMKLISNLSSPCPHWEGSLLPAGRLYGRVKSPGTAGAGSCE